MFRKLLIFICAFLPAACVFNGPPKGLLLETGSHPSTPVLVQEILINGASVQRGEALQASGWADPKGSTASSLSMPIDAADKSRLHLSAQWVDLGQNTTFRGAIAARMSDLDVLTGGTPTGRVIVLFGPDGYLELATSAPPDATGQYNGRIIATTCAEAGPGLAADHRIWQDARYLRLKDDPTPAPDMGCGS